jgi:hypothetical protein
VDALREQRMRAVGMFEAGCRMSMAGVVAYRPDRSRAKLIFQTKPGSYNTDSLIEFLKQLRRPCAANPSC